MRRWLATGPDAELLRVPWPRAERIALGALLTGMLASLFWLAHPWYDPVTDASMYVCTARSLLDGDGYGYLGEPFRMRPPGFSVLLAGVMAVAGRSAFHAFNLFVGLWGVAALGLLHVFLRSRIGRTASLLCVAAIWLNPGWQRFCNQVLSDVPGLALFVGCLLLERRARRLPSLASELSLGALIGISVYVRSMTLLLVPAILAARVLDRLVSGAGGLSLGAFLGKRIVPVCAGTFLVLAPWSVRNALHEFPVPADQTMHYSYSTGMWNEDSADPRSPRLPPGKILARFPERSRQMAAALGSRLRSPALTTEHVLVSVCLLAALGLVLVKRRAPVDLFHVLSLAVISLYFGFGDRLLIYAFVFGTAAVLELLGDVVRAASGRDARAVLAALVLVPLTAHDLAPRAGWEDVRQLHDGFVRLAQQVRARVPEQTTLGAMAGFHDSVYLDRPVYSLFFTLERSGGDPRVLEEAITRYGIEVVILSPFIAQADAIRPYLRARYGSAFQRAGLGSLVRVRE